MEAPRPLKEAMMSELLTAPTVMAPEAQPGLETPLALLPAAITTGTPNEATLLTLAARVVESQSEVYVVVLPRLMLMASGFLDAAQSRPAMMSEVKQPLRPQTLTM